MMSLSLCPSSLVSSLMSSLSPFLINNVYSDVELICDCKRSIRAHRLVLASLSPMLYEAMRENPDDVLVVHVPWMSHEKLDAFLHAVYDSRTSDDQEEILVDDDLVALGIDVVSSVVKKEVDDVNHYDTLFNPGSVKRVNNNNKIFSPEHDFGLRRRGRTSRAAVTATRAKGGFRVKTVETEEMRTCSECGKTYSSRKAMLYHAKVVHSGVRPHRCEQCGLTFARIDSFKQHTHANDRPFLCSVCGKTFTRRHIRDLHERSHRNERPHACSFCSKRFLTHQQCAIHERTHTGERPFQCSECGRQFSQKHQLTTHMRIHTGEKPYECQQCGQKFRHLSSRNNHRCAPRINLEAHIKKL